MNDKLIEAFDLATNTNVPAVIEAEECKALTVYEEPTEAIEVKDFVDARTHLKTVVATGLDAMASLTKLAKAADKPSAYEALSNLMKATTEAINRSVEMHYVRSDHKTKNEDKENSPAKQQQTNVYITTTELQEMIRNSNHQNVIDVESTEATD